MKILTMNCVYIDVGGNAKNPIPLAVLGLLVSHAVAMHCTRPAVADQPSYPLHLALFWCAFFLMPPGTRGGGTSYALLRGVRSAAEALGSAPDSRSLLAWLAESAACLAAAVAPLQPAAQAALRRAGDTAAAGHGGAAAGAATVLAGHTLGFLLAGWTGQLFAFAGHGVSWAAAACGGEAGALAQFSQQHKARRRALLLKEVKRLAPDVLCLQECCPFVWSTHHVDALLGT